MKYVIYKVLGDFYVTTKENYDVRIRNSREIIKAVGFETAEEIVEYYCKNIRVKPEDFIIISGRN